ncbi:MAG: lipoate--protein ligase family protein [Planctomycetaceae bacterium]|nr:lipoate--protein ligase family protein [Planctomycetaceae bacterium]
MEFSEHTLPTISQNLAFDEWLLDRAAASHHSLEFLRIWRPQSYAVVIGRGSKYFEEVDPAFCERHNVGVFRRHSGGAAIVTGPGCWMYAVVLDLRQRGELRDLHVAHRIVMDKIRSAAQVICRHSTIHLQGTCDLTIQNQKCSGNSLRVVKNHLLYHGTLLVDFDLTLLSGCLRTPPRQPDYREQRPHDRFVANLAEGCLAGESSLWELWKQAIQRSWNVQDSGVTVTESDLLAVARLAQEKYESPDWTMAR